jgi:hypothetical protein
MNNTMNINYDEIESNIMIILMADENKIYTKSELYNNLIDKMNINYLLIDQQFKLRYMTVLNQLPSKYDIKITNNLISSANEINFENYENKELIFDTVLPSMEEVSEFIVKNDMQDQAGYENLASDLIRGNKILMVEKLLNSSNNLFFLKNNSLRKINNQDMTNLFLENLYEKVINLKKENIELNNKIIELNNKILKLDNNISFYQLFCNKIKLLIIKYNNDINFILVIGLTLFMLFINPLWLHITSLLTLFLYIINYNITKFILK